MTTPLALPEYPESGGFMFNERDALLAANDYLVRKNAYWESRCRVAVGAIAEHNHECMSRCGVDAQEGVACGYRPYFPRHCPNCPRGEMINDAYGVPLEELLGPLPELPAQPARGET